MTVDLEGAIPPRRQHRCASPLVPIGVATRDLVARNAKRFECRGRDVHGRAAGDSRRQAESDQRCPTCAEHRPMLPRATVRSSGAAYAHAIAKRVWAGGRGGALRVLRARVVRIAGARDAGAVHVVRRRVGRGLDRGDRGVGLERCGRGSTAPRDECGREHRQSNREPGRPHVSVNCERRARSSRGATTRSALSALLHTGTGVRAWRLRPH